MTDIIVTDLFGNKIDSTCSTPYILIHITNPKLVLDKLDTYIYDSIYDINYIKLQELLQDHKSNITSNKNIFGEHLQENKQEEQKLSNINGWNLKNYFSLGHIWAPVKNLVDPVTIVLLNKNAYDVGKVIDYELVSEYGSGYIYKPIGLPGYTALGLVYAKSKPSNLNICTVLADKTIKYNAHYFLVENMTNMNEFYLLGTTDIDRITINRSLYAQSTDFYIQQKSKTIGVEDGKVVMIKQPQKQNVSYTAQGELKLNSQCLGILDDHRGDRFVYPQKCDNSLNQKWFPYEDHVISLYDKTCLTTGNDNYLTSVSCSSIDNSQKYEFIKNTVNNDNNNDEEKEKENDDDNNDEEKENNDNNNDEENNDDNNDDNKQTNNKQTHNGENALETKINAFKKIKGNGKKVVLVESNNPWYINKDLSDPIDPSHIIKMVDDRISLNDYPQSAPYKSKFVMDKMSASMGYGHSFADHQGKPCNYPKLCDKVEGFSQKKSKKPKFSKIILILLVAFIILITMKIWFSKNNECGQETLFLLSSEY
jgi:hypothetical protein